MSKHLSLEEINRSIDALFNKLSTRSEQVAAEPEAQELDEPAESPQSVVFLEGEVLIFGGMTKSLVTTALVNMGIMPDAFSLTTEGPPLFFTSSTTVPDTAAPPVYFLTHEDLPYGFVGTDEEPGTFQFSSPELAKLTLPPNPQVVDDAYVFIGDDASNVTYDMIDKATDDRYKVLMYGLGWVPATNKAGAAQDVREGKFTNVDFSGDKRYFADKGPLLGAVNSSTGTHSTPVEGGIGNNYVPDVFAGWTWPVISQRNPSPNTVTANIIQMPRNQLQSFEVNPDTQQPYRGAEGVYPVILAEILRDVNIDF